MNDTFTEATSQSWFNRIGGAIKGLLFGLILVVVGIGLLFWNEGRAVKTHKALVESQGLVMTVDANEYQSFMNDKLIHLSGKATTTEILSDGTFNVSVIALKLKRIVETYQWEETSRSEEKKKLGGGTETVTTYEYRKVWSDGLNNSAQFKQPEGHKNPHNVPYESNSWSGNNVHIGEYELSSQLKSHISNYQSLPLENAAVASSGIKRHGDQFYYGEDPQQPQIGDQRIQFQVIYPQAYSVVGWLSGSSVVPHTASNGREIALIKVGTHTADEMFEQAKSDNAKLTWILRFVGTLLLVIAISMIMKPLSVVADILPLAGNIVAMGTGFIALIVGISIALITISGAWIAFRPLVGIGLLAIVGGLAYVGINKSKKTKERIATGPPPRPPV